MELNNILTLRLDYQNRFVCNEWFDGYIKTFYTTEEFNSHVSKLTSLNETLGNGKIGNLLYIGKGSNLPRHKVKSFIEEKQLKKTTIIEKADTVVFDKKLIGDVLKWYKSSKETKVAIIPFTEKIYSFISKHSNDNNNVFIKKFNAKASLVIYEDMYQKYPHKFKTFFGKLDFKSFYELNSYRTQNLKNIKETIDYYFTNPHGNIIWDDSLLDVLNNDGIELDDEYISTLDSMFASGDSDNIKLALEMLANVNLEKFGLTIALLLNKWKSQLSWGSGNTSSQAFKTLVRYFKNKDIKWEKDYRSLGAGLYKNYSYDDNARAIIENFVLQNINTYLKQHSELYNLQITNFKIELHSKK